MRICVVGNRAVGWRSGDDEVLVGYGSWEEEGRCGLRSV